AVAVSAAQELLTSSSACRTPRSFSTDRKPARARTAWPRLPAHELDAPQLHPLAPCNHSSDGRLLGAACVRSDERESLDDDVCGALDRERDRVLRGDAGAVGDTSTTALAVVPAVEAYAGAAHDERLLVGAIADVDVLLFAPSAEDRGLERGQRRVERPRGRVISSRRDEERARHVAVDAVAVGVLEAIIRLVLARRDAGWFRALSAGSARSPGQLWGRACSVSDGSTEGRRTRTLASSTSNLGSSGRRAPRCG